MGNLNVIGKPGQDWYAIGQSGSQFLNGTALETYNSAQWSTYAIALADPNSLGTFTGAMPLAPAGLYQVNFCQQVGGSPALADAPPKTGFAGWWNGTAFLGDIGSLLNVGTLVNAPAGMATTQNQATLLAAINALVPSTIPGAYIGNFTIQDNSSNPIQAAIIRLSLNGVPQGSFTTDANGNATTSIDNRVYTIAATYPGFSFTPTTFNAGTGGSFTFHMTRLTPAAAPNPSECRIQDYLTDQSGNPLGGARIAWNLDPVGVHVGTRKGEIISDATSGYWYLDVIQGTGDYTFDRQRISNVIFPEITVTAANTTGSSYIVGT